MRRTSPARAPICSTLRRRSAIPNGALRSRAISICGWRVSARRLPVMYLSAGGAVAGSGTMMDAVIAAAGGRNVRTDASWTVMPLERLVETPPALVALGFFDHGRTRINPWLPGRHPAMRSALERARTVSLPPAAISCEAWYAIDAAEQIAAALRSS